MSTEPEPRLSPSARTFVAAICASGFSVVALSGYQLLVNRPSVDFGWLALLTLASGFLPVKLPWL